MKKFLLLFFFLLSIKSFSQTDFRFADSTAQWNILVHSHDWWQSTLGTIGFNVDGDTIIGSLQYQKLRSFNGVYDFIRRDSLNRIYAHNIYDTLDFLIYDFSKTTGDTFSVKSSRGMDNGVRFYVCSVDTVNWGRPRKRMFLSVDNNSDCAHPQNVAIDGIGMIRAHFLYPELENYIFDGDYYELLCFFELGQRFYHNSNYPDTCLIDGFSSVEQVQKNTIHLSPNPNATSSITIQSEINFPEQTEFQLFDITGRMVLQKQLSDKTSRVELNELSKGMYLYSITSSKQRIGSGKLVVE